MSEPTKAPTNVLVVEDEMVLRMKAMDIVEDAGFTAIEAVNADEALAILESRSDISLLFSDIQMPGSMDGLMLAHAVQDRWPSIKIILVSGQVKVSDADKPADSRFFGKPLEVKQMIAELQEMVGAGTLKIVPKEAIPLAAIARANGKHSGSARPSDSPRKSLPPKMTAFGFYWSRPTSTQRPCWPKPESTQRNVKPPTSCRSLFSRKCIIASRTRSRR